LAYHSIANIPEAEKAINKASELDTSNTYKERLDSIRDQLSNEKTSTK